MGAGAGLAPGLTDYTPLLSQPSPTRYLKVGWAAGELRTGADTDRSQPLQGETSHQLSFSSISPTPPPTSQPPTPPPTSTPYAGRWLSKRPASAGRLHKALVSTWDIFCL